MADADAAKAVSEAVRAEAVKVLLLDHEGHTFEALARSRALMLAHRGEVVAHRLLGELHYAAAVREARREGATREARKAAAGRYLRVARDALAAARRLAPDCVDVAASLAEALAASSMYAEAEAEFRRAQEGIARPSDPALSNAAFGMFEGYEHERHPAFAAERVKDARERARASYARMVLEELVPIAVQRVLVAGARSGAAEGRKRAKLVAESFPNLARAQLLQAYMDLEFARSLDAAIDKRPFLRRTLAIAERAAEAFPKSSVVASFHAKLLFVLGDYDAAERECRRALLMDDEPDDPQQDCIPVGSISGENRGARLVSLACEFHELNNKILTAASDYWDAMSYARQRDSFLRVSFRVLEDEYRKVDQSYAFSMADVENFVYEYDSWSFWVCPICDRNKFVDSRLLLSHMCSKHPRAVLPRLQTLLDDRTLGDQALEDEDCLDGVTFDEDTDNVICFSKSRGAFKWLFYAPSSGVVAKPLPEIQESSRTQGCMLLESIKEKMKTLPAEKSRTFSEAVPRIKELWRKFLKTSVLDYRGIILILARSVLWRKLKKCMSEDPELGAKKISAADIDAVFAKETEPSLAEGDSETGDNKQPSQADVALMVGDYQEESGVDVKGESSQKPAHNTESPGLGGSVTESKNDLDANLDKLAIDPKISEKNQESDVVVKDESSQKSKSPGSGGSVTKNKNDLDVKLDKLAIDPKISENIQESAVQVEHDASSETPADNTESSDLATSVTERSDLDATLHKLDTEESEVQAEGDSSEAAVTNTADPAVNKADSVDDVDAKLENLHINPIPDSSIEASGGAESSGQNEQQD